MVEIKKENQKVIFTKKALHEGLIELLQTKNLNEISVTEVCEISEINRGTFYKHYGDVAALLKDIEDLFFSHVKRFVIEKHGCSNVDVITNMLLDVVENIKLFNLMMQRKTSREFSDDIFNFARSIIMASWTQSFPNVALITLENMYVFVASGVQGIIYAWIRNGMSQPISSVAKSINIFLLPYRIVF